MDDLSNDPPPRRPGFQGSSFGDDTFRDDRFEDASHRDAYESLEDALAEDDRPLASPWTRLGAQLLDGVTAMIVVVGAAIAAGIGSLVSDDVAGGLAVIVGLVLGIGLLVYQLRLLAAEGQTIGKRALKLRIVDATDGTNPGFVRTFWLRTMANAAIGAVIPFYSILDSVFIFRDDRKCIHDHLAKTVVVTEAEATYAGRVAY